MTGGWDANANVKVYARKINAKGMKVLHLKIKLKMEIRKMLAFSAYSECRTQKCLYPLSGLHSNGTKDLFEFF